MLGVIVWDPSRAMIPWNIPILGRPILWYGFFFAIGFFVAYFLTVYFLKSYFDQHVTKDTKESKKNAKLLAEKALIYAVIGTLIGARLGDVFLYQNLQDFTRDPLSFFRIWEGGLASHGGALGVFVAFWLFYRSVKKHHKEVYLPFLALLDLVTIPVSFVGACIRLGNFFNQEILGVPTALPWGVVFGHPADGSFPCPRHPVQLYESFCYLCTGLILYGLWRKDKSLQRPGRLFGLFLVLLFSFRFLIEGVKEEQSVFFIPDVLTMGQWLSIPFVLSGVFILWKTRKRG